MLWFLFLLTWFAILGSGYDDRKLKEILAEIYKALLIVLMILANENQELRLKISKMINPDKLPYELWDKVDTYFDETYDDSWWYPRRIKILKRIKGVHGLCGGDEE